MRKCIAVAVLVASLAITSLALAKGPGVVASGNKARQIASAKCVSREVFLEFGIPFVRCDTYGADFCHIPRYNTQLVFCVSYFWLHRPFANLRYSYEFCTSPKVFKRSRYGKPKVTKPYFSWTCDYRGYGPPDA